MKRLRLKALSVGLAIALLSGLVWVNYLQHKTNEAKLELEIKQSQLKLNELEVKSVESKTKADQLLRDKQELEKQLQTKKEEAERIAEAKVQVTQVASAAPVAVVSTTNCGDNVYKQYIYQHESGCRTDARNSIGCLGIGQACPGSKILNVCPDLNFACQDAWFSNYAISRYGSWANAYAFWIANRWW